MKKTLLAALIATFTSHATWAGDLYKVKVTSSPDAAQLRATGATGLVILTDGYLVLTDSTSRARLERSSLQFNLLATDIAADNLAYDMSLSPRSRARSSVLYEDSRLRICRIPESAASIESFIDPQYCPINSCGIPIRYLESSHTARELVQRLYPLGVSLDSVIAQVSQDSLYAITAKLQSYGPRNAGSPADSLACDWLEAKFQALGYDSVIADPFTGYYYGFVPCRNIIAYKIGTRFPNHQIVIGAHLDSYGPSPGADDNASGCAGVLEIARILKDIPTDLTVVFALFGSEELWMWGSYHYVYDALRNDDSIMYMLNLDMIGFAGNVDSVNVHHSTQTELSTLWIHLADSLVGIKGVLAGLSASDHLPFAQVGIEVSFIIEWLFNEYYHSSQDSTTHMDFAYMTRLVKASLATAYTVAMTAWPKPTLVLRFPDGQPHWFPPGGLIPIEVEIFPVYGDQIVIVPGTPSMLYAFGEEGYRYVPLLPVGSDRYRAFLPSDTCATRCYFNATALDTAGYWHYSSGSEEPHRAVVSTDSTIVFEDDFETDKGWTVTGDARQGQWERSVPGADGFNGDPTTDYDGSGKCFLTGNLTGSSYVYGGTTSLKSPIFDASGSDALIYFAVWYSNTKAFYSASQTMKVYLSVDSGINWITLQTIGPGAAAAGGWHEYTLLTRDLVTTTDKMCLWFDVRNTNNSTMVEAALDAVSVVRLNCSSSSCCQGVTGNVNRIGIVDLSDLSALVSYLTGGGYVLPCAEEANINNVGIVDLSDLSALVSYLTGGGYVLLNCL